MAQLKEASKREYLATKRQIEAQSVQKVNAYVTQLEAQIRQKVNDAILKDRAAVQSHVQEERAAMAREKEARLRRGYFVILPPLFSFVCRIPIVTRNFSE
jgi:hypothetical protein